MVHPEAELAPRQGHVERKFTWRRPRPGAQPRFEVFVSSRWTVAGLVLSVGAVLWLARTGVQRAKTFQNLLLAGLGAGVLALLEGFRGAAFPRLNRVDLPIGCLPRDLDGLRIAQLSDLHLGVALTRAAAHRATALIMAEQPDLIVLTGDYVSFRRHLPLLRTALAPLAAPCGILAIFGNHDHWTDVGAIARLFHELGIEVLVNAHRVIRVGQAHLVVAGVDDMWDGRPDLAGALQGAPPGAPIVLLAHSPDYADEAARSPAAVQLAGHTHAGHIRLPGLGPLFLPRHGLRYYRGLHRVGHMWLYVSHGIGGWPIRIGARSEAPMFTLKRKA